MNLDDCGSEHIFNEIDYFYTLKYSMLTFNGSILFWLLQAQDELLKENKLLRSQIEMQNEQLAALRNHIGLIRQHTIAFILDQMDTLHMQRDTEVWPRQCHAAGVVPPSHSTGRRTAPFSY